MNLIIFDIDGTLTHINEEDSKCFAKAIKDVLQVNIDTNWASYRYSTDSGIIKEIYESFFKREPSETEINTIQEYFFTYLNDACLTDPAFIKPIIGADTISPKYSPVRKSGCNVVCDQSSHWSHCARTLAFSDQNSPLL